MCLKIGMTRSLTLVFPRVILTLWATLMAPRSPLSARASGGVQFMASTLKQQGKLIPVTQPHQHSVLWVGM